MLPGIEFYMPAKTRGRDEEAGRGSSLRPLVLNGGNFAPRKHLAMSGDIFGCVHRARA